MKKLLVATVIACAMLAAFGYGVSVGRHEAFPFQLLRDIKQMAFPPPLPHENWGPSYKRRLSHLRSLPESPVVVMIGDSITREGEWREMLPEIPVANRGIGGDTTQGVLDRLNDSLDTSPEWVFVMIGINDLDHGIPVSTVVANIQTILSTIQASGAAPVFQSTLHVGPVRPPSTNEKIAQINDAVRQFCQQSGIAFIDLNASLAPNGSLELPYTIDGVHLTGEGYTIWAEEVRRHIGPMPPEARTGVCHDGSITR
ncbi:GDSL-type esterase/lipase family protein [Phycisphaerales bacterium AB-hyl4]|uniref:GDSL-type esterase/lipase family protein n=1 Tax=Natronomicrosphaera hydrolytica TaxID=3242702 RepID=A0ABV4U0Y3_9BACT